MVQRPHPIVKPQRVFPASVTLANTIPCSRCCVLSGSRSMPHCGFVPLVSEKLES